MHYVKAVAALGVLAILIGGCASSADTKQETESAQPQTQQPQEVISPEARQNYDNALSAMRNGDNEKAKNLLLSLSDTNPDLSGPYTNLGLIYFREGDTAKAEEAFTRAIKINPKSAVSYNHLGIISRSKGKFQEAKAHYEQALSINQDYAYAHLNIGILYDLYLGEMDKALDHYKRFQELSPDKDPDVEKWIVDLERRIKAK